MTWPDSSKDNSAKTLNLFTESEIENKIIYIKWREREREILKYSKMQEKGKWREIIKVPKGKQKQNVRKWKKNKGI